MRELKTELKSAVTVEQLRERSRLDQGRFETALKEAFLCNGIQWSDESRAHLVEGSNQVNQPDPQQASVFFHA